MSRIPPHAARVVSAWPSQHEPQRRQPRARRESVLSRILHPLRQPLPEVRIETPAPRPTAKPARPA
ncbi:hypothetical protein GCM10027053_07780 [Intrasporangium mesophilum]